MTDNKKVIIGFLGKKRLVKILQETILLKNTTL